MKRALVLAAALVLILPAIAAAQSAEADKEAAIKTALDYSDGGYSGDAARMEGALHTDLNKLFFFRRSPAMGLAAGYSCVSDLVELTRLGMLNLAPDKRMTDVAVLEIMEDVACVRLRTARWCDYLQMVKSDGRWKIVNVLWTPGLTTPPERRIVPGFDGEKERPAALAAVLDYVEGLLAADAARVEKVLHPETSQIVYRLAAKSGKAVIGRTRYSGILEPVKAKLGAAPEAARKAEARIIDLMEGMAFAAAATAQGSLYLQLQLIDGQWKVINVLIRPANNAFPPQAPPAKK
jgi:hypothetical protein